MVLNILENTSMKAKANSTHTSLIMCLMIIAVLFDVYLFTLSSDIRIIALLGIYYYIQRRWRVHSATTFGISFILLCITYTQFLFTAPMAFDNPSVIPPHSERTAVWLYLFLVVGIIQKWRE